eukprot:gene26329-biopygen15853
MLDWIGLIGPGWDILDCIGLIGPGWDILDVRDRNRAGIKVTNPVRSPGSGAGFQLDSGRDHDIIIMKSMHPIGL